VAKDEDETAQQGTPLVLVKPPKPMGEMTDAERGAFADDLFDMIAATRKPAKGNDR
jgi:hypothetical protein